jgi:hypothetical protein
MRDGSRHTGARALARAALACAVAWGLLPGAAAAQVFIASNPRPDFWIAPIFVTANVTPEDVGRRYRPLTVSVSFSVAPPPGRDPADIAQDIFLLWPGHVVGAPGQDGSDPELVRRVAGAGFVIREHGVLRLSARSRQQMGTGAGAAGLKQLGDAPFVTFARPESGRALRAATFIRIPWRPELAHLDWLARIEMPMRDAITARRARWLEETFWGRRHVVTVSFGDVGGSSVYPLYFGNRDRVIPLAPDFSMLVINFADAPHLKLDEIVPVSANRRMSETRERTETLQLPLQAADALTPQVLKAQFVYFTGRLPWRPIIISAIVLGLGNLTGPLIGGLLRRLARTLRARIQVGRGEARSRQSGVVPSREVLERIRPGVTTYDEVLRLCGDDPEEEQRLPTGGIRAIVYRGQRVVPRRRRSFGWFATVSHWDVEHQEVRIEFDQDRVSDIQAGVRRTRLAQPAPRA